MTQEAAISSNPATVKNNAADILEILLLITPETKKSSFEKIQNLLALGVELNEPVDTNGNTLLHYLIIHGKSDLAVDFLKFLKELSQSTKNKTINHLINFTLKNNEGKTPIYLAVHAEFEEVVETIVKSSDVASNGVDITDNEGRSPIMIAAALGYRLCAFWLINSSANLYLKDKLGYDLEYYMHAPEEKMSELLNANVYPDNSSSSEDSALIIAKCIENQKATRLLIQEHLLRHACLLGNIDKVKECIEAGADPFKKDLVLFRKNALQYTFIFSASNINNFIQLYGLNYNAEDCIKNHAAICQFLLEKFPRLASTTQADDFLVLKHTIHNGSDAEKESAKVILQELEYEVKAECPQPKKTPSNQDYTVIETPVVGSLLFWNINKPLDITDHIINQNLLWCIEHIHEYDKFKDQYEKLIQNDETVKWYLIPCLIFDEQIQKIRILKQLPYPTLGKNNKHLLQNKALFSFLKRSGAKSQHIFFQSTPTFKLTLEELDTALNLFPNDVVVTPTDAVSFVGHCAIRLHENRETQLMMEKALTAGADINQRIDKTYNNTALHYCIALEAPHVLENAIKLIEISENFRAKKAGSNCIIDYTLRDNDGKTPLLLAVELGAESVVEKLLSLHRKGVDIGLNICDNKGRSPLMCGSALGHKSIVNKLLHTGANVWSKDSHGEKRDLTYYMQAPEAEVKDILTSASVYPYRAYGCHNYVYSDISFQPPLTLSDKQGNKIYVSLSPKDYAYQDLLKATLYLLFPKEKDKSSFILPISFEVFFKTIAEFLDFRKDSPKLLPLINQYKEYLELWKALREIIEKNPKNSSELLSIIKKYPKPDVLQKIIELTTDFFAGNLLNIPTQLEHCIENQAETQLIIKEHLFRLACVLGDIDSVNTLLSENEALIHSCDEHGRTPLHYAVMRKEFVEKYLKAKYPHLNEGELSNETSKCLKNHSSIVQLLLEKGANPNKQHHQHRSSYDILNNIAQSNNEFSAQDVDTAKELLPILCEYKLRIACVLGDLKTVKELIEKNKHLVNTTDSNGKTLLHYTLSDEQFVKTYLQRYDTLTTQNNLSKKTNECMKNHIKIFEFLLSQGADSNITDHSGTSIRSLLQNTRKSAYIKKCTETENHTAGEMLKILDNFQHKNEAASSATSHFAYG